MNRRIASALVVYAVLMASLWTPLYQPLSAGRNDSWALLVLLAGAHLGVGIIVRRIWVLLLPAALAIAWFVTAGAEGLAWLVLIIGAPVLIAFTALVWLMGRSLGRHGTPVAIAAFVIAALPGSWAAVETAKRGPHVAAGVQARLPTELSLGNLCPHTETPGALRRELRSGAQLMVKLLRRRPNDLVTYTYYYEEGDDERRHITIKELAEEQLKDLESVPGCAPKLKRQIQAALQ